MAPRRRFFPSTKVQTVPGRTVELEMQLRPVARVPSKGGDSSNGGGADIPKVGWFSPVFDPRDHGWYSSLEPDGRWRINDEWAVPLSLWEGIPEEGVPPVPTEAFRCVELTVLDDWRGGDATRHIGVLQGADMANAYWEASWDNPSAEHPHISAGGGNKFFTWGNTLLVEAINKHGSGIDGMDTTETITATAYNNGVAVGTLILNCWHGAF